MNPEKLDQLTPGAQEAVEAHRQFDTELNEVSVITEQLMMRMRTVKSTLAELVIDLPYEINKGVIPIVLKIIRDDDTTEQPKPYGVDEVQIEPRKLYGDKYHYMHDRDTLESHQLWNVEFLLEFRFRSTDDENREQEKGLGHNETTLWSDEDFGDDQPPFTYYTHSHGGMPTPKREYSEKNAQALAYYKEHVLPAITGKIEDLEQSIEFINASLDNPELNPWYPEFLEVRRRLAEEQLQQDLKRQRDAAVHEEYSLTPLGKEVADHRQRKARWLPGRSSR